MFQSISGKFNGLGGSIAEISINSEVYKIQSKLINSTANFARKYSTFISLLASFAASLIILPKTTNYINIISLFLMCTGAIISSTISPIYFKFIAIKKMHYNTLIQVGTTLSLIFSLYFSYILENKFNFLSIFLLTCISTFIGHITCYLIFEKSKNLIFKN